MKKEKQSKKEEDDQNMNKIFGFDHDDSRLHEEVIWIFGSDCIVLNEYSYLMRSDKIIWSVGNKSRTTTDVRFHIGNKIVSMKVTKLK